ncbi:MAG: BatA domain-containing protein [Candidatus Latescibacteria bacterium]|nr:BatA domain-containing protein [Candidatus Latescibacterota bacterium]
MQFLNPLALIGLVAALIPLAIHLLHRGQSQPQPFSNLDFLRRLHHSRLRRLRLRQWLVLLLRTLIIALIALAFARPAHQGGAGWGGSTAPVATAVLLDCSYSTGFRQGGGSLFEPLRHQTRELLDIFSKRDEVALFPFASRLLTSEPAAGNDQLAKVVEELQPTQEGTDLEAALQAAADFCAAHPQLRQEIYLLSDLTQHNWAQLAAKTDWLPQAQVYIADLGTAERGNVHVDEVKFSAWLAAPGKKLSARALLTNTSSQAAPQTAVDVYLDGERVRHQLTDLRPGEEFQFDFALTPRRAGLLGGYVEIQDDALSLDNRRYFTLSVPDSFRVLVLGHQPEDTYYPRRALAASAATDPALALRFGLIDQLEPSLLQQTQVLLLCNLNYLSAEQTKVVQGFVADGGSLVVFPSPQADLNFFNRQLLPALIPSRLAQVAGQPGNQSAGQGLNTQLPHHPLLDGLFTQVAGDQPRFRAFYSLVSAPAADQESAALVHFADGQPAATLCWQEQGRTVLFATPLSLEWNDLPLKGLFAPLMHRLVRYLSLPADPDQPYLVGQPLRRYLPGAHIDDRLQAETPSGRKVWLSGVMQGGRCWWQIPRAEEAGLWRLWQEGRLVDLFAVNPDPREADLSLVPRQRLEQLFGADRTRFFGPRDELRSLVLGNRYGRELWRECLALALVLLLLELWLARAPQRRTPVPA